MRTHLSFLFLFCVLCTACWQWTRPGDTLPAATQQGAQTLGFSFENGSVWTPYGPGETTILGSEKLWGSYEIYEVDSVQYVDLYIDATRRARRDRDTTNGFTISLVGIRLDDFEREITLQGGHEDSIRWRGVFEEIPGGTARFNAETEEDFTSHAVFRTDSLRQGFVRLTALDTTPTDSTLGFFSGEFEMSLYDAELDSTLRMLNGRFDVLVE